MPAPRLLPVGLLLVATLTGASPAQAADGTLLPRVPGSETQAVVGSGGAWCWFSDPRSVHVPGPAKRTFASWIDAEGSIVVSAYDHTTKRLQSAVVRTAFVVDDHNNPSLLRHADGRVSVFWSGHNGPAIHIRTTSRPGDVTSFAPTRTITSFVPGDSVVTYTNPVRVPGEGDRIYLFFRSGYSHQGYVTSDDDGVTWSAARVVVSNGDMRPYVKVAGDGGSGIALAFTDGHPDELTSSVRFSRYTAGELRGADGRLLGALADGIEAGQGDLLWDGPATGTSGWVHDVAVGPDGLPVVVFATIRSTTDHRYHWARFDGTSWVVRELGPAGGTVATGGRERSYSAGITLDHDEPSVVYLARPGSDPAIAEVERWTTRDHGASWVAEAVTSASTETNLRPVRPRGLPDGLDMEALWMSGAYPHFTTFRTSLRGTAAVVPGQPVATTTRINAAVLSVVPGSSLRVSARLVDPTGAAVLDREVTLLSRPLGLTTWGHVAELRTGLDGLVHFQPTPVGSTEYAVTWPGDDSFSPSRSPAALVRSTRPTTALTAVVTRTARLGRSVTTGALLRTGDGRPAAGQRVELLGREPGTTTVRVLAARTTGPDGRVLLPARLARPTDVQVRFTGTATHVGNATPWRRVTLR
ncbi:MAG: BNR-4 repeat-containing protein [Mycobacteriales bacterium]|nr:BNR-4 repeat-containing protein [Mycobacteriales bacterium]